MTQSVRHTLHTFPVTVASREGSTRCGFLPRGASSRNAWQVKHANPLQPCVTPRGAQLPPPTSSGRITYLSPIPRLPFSHLPSASTDFPRTCLSRLSSYFLLLCATEHTLRRRCAYLLPVSAFLLIVPTSPFTGDCRIALPHSLLTVS